MSECLLDVSKVARCNVSERVLRWGGWTRQMLQLDTKKSERAVTTAKAGHVWVAPPDPSTSMA